MYRQGPNLGFSLQTSSSRNMKLALVYLKSRNAKMQTYKCAVVLIASCKMWDARTDSLTITETRHELMFSVSAKVQVAQNVRVFSDCLHKRTVYVPRKQTDSGFVHQVYIVFHFTSSALFLFRCCTHYLQHLNNFCFSLIVLEGVTVVEKEVI